MDHRFSHGYLAGFVKYSVSNLTAIVAHNQQGVIGKQNQLPWHIPQDLKWFKQHTTNQTIIVGRKTFESLPGVLPNRHTIVVTNQLDFVVNHSNVTVVHSVDQAVAQASTPLVFVAGGEQIYRALIGQCSRVLATVVKCKVEGGDAFFDPLNSEWQLINQWPGGEWWSHCEYVRVDD